MKAVWQIEIGNISADSGSEVASKKNVMFEYCIHNIQCCNRRDGPGVMHVGRQTNEGRSFIGWDHADPLICLSFAALPSTWGLLTDGVGSLEEVLILVRFKCSLFTV